MRLPQNEELIAWIDVETTGLDPIENDLLEISAIVTDSLLREVADLSVVIRPDRPSWRERMDEYVRDMHTGNGLLDDIDERGVPVQDADALVSAFLASLSPEHALVLGGNSITLDRGFLDAWAPGTFSRLHYRSIDDSSVRAFLTRICGFDMPETPKGSHRGIDDLRACIASEIAMRDWLLKRIP